jgi:hypothetical protein
MPPERGHVHADEPGDDDFDERDESLGRWSTDPGAGSQSRGIAIISATTAVAASEMRRFYRRAGGRSEPSTPSVKLTAFGRGTAGAGDDRSELDPSLQALPTAYTA